ncbi:RNA polymerase sigma-54 factor [Caprobacter fermentans]|uniref:RNA polymerase sigma-54 factor n=1 Tax=Caproicibacter fermentans TaxID=2576756 RepID=A0A6N8HW97_9FIRM|nr:RNA polymerase factor sigma-54 [Caproicibacter fermentans]MVB10094.1 RNA polymerase sigma-54 factor [Caproicibacter fermentans]OCN03362.1 RNA polymerase sigma-54 factor [Clostridium sp. W14A]
MDLLQEISQKQTLSLLQTQSLKILMMNNSELYDFLQREQMENPVLELEGGSEEEKIRSVGDWFCRQGHGPESIEWDDEEREPARKEDQTISLQESLKSQIRLRMYTKREIQLIQYIIDLLDEDGYLTVSADEISSLTNCSPDQVRKCIDAVQCMEPAGVGAGSLCECLLLQLEAKGLWDRNLASIVENHLPEVAYGHYHKLARQLSLPIKEVKEYVAVLHTLNPRPGSGFGCPENPAYIIPDVLIDRQEDSWEITLNDRWIGSVGVSRMYEALYHHSKDPGTTEYLKEKIRRAQFIVKSVEQRRNTLLRVTRVVLDRQKEYFEGRGPLAPLNLSMVSSELKLHESTVSRAIREKYLQSPAGTRLFKDFFSAGVASCGETMSSHAVKEMIVRLIREEDAARPLSDSALAEKLKGSGVNLSRRTVAKYRDELKIKNAFERRSLK